MELVYIAIAVVVVGAVFLVGCVEVSEPKIEETKIDESGIVKSVQFGSETNVCGTLFVTTSSVDRWMAVTFEDGRVIKVPTDKDVKIMIGKKYRIAYVKWDNKRWWETIIEEVE